MSLHSQGASRGTATLFGVPKGGRILWVMPGLGFGDILAQLRWELGEQGCCEQVEKLQEPSVPPQMPPLVGTGDTRSQSCHCGPSSSSSPSQHNFITSPSLGMSVVPLFWGSEQHFRAAARRDTQGWFWWHITSSGCWICCCPRGCRVGPAPFALL